MAIQYLMIVFIGLADSLYLVAGKDVCYGQQSQLTCGRNKVIVMTSAEYGHISVGKCISEEDPRYIGCSNDVLPLFDKWCSGKRECTFGTPNEDIDRMNNNCPNFLLKYLSLHHDCIEVSATCSSNRATRITEEEGYISSYIVHTKGCGLQRNPWIISANPGQTIQLNLIDFSTNPQSSNLVSCRSVYGFIIEKSLGINQTICGGRHREMALYTSKTNSIQIHLVKNNKENNGEFLIKYKVMGCSELTPPKHAWYKREGDEAVIGCQDNDKEWKVKCTGNVWIGEIGNCTKTVIEKIPLTTKKQNLAFTSVVIMASIIGGAVVLSVIAIVVGVVYVKKYRMHQETKRATLVHKTYSTLDRNIQAYYRPVTMDQSVDNRTLWDIPPSSQPEGQTMSSADQCTCATLQMRNNIDNDKRTEITSLERQSISKCRWSLCLVTYTTLWTL